MACSPELPTVRDFDPHDTGPAPMTLAILSLVGVALFSWPFLAATDTPDLPALAIAIGAFAGLLLTEVGARRLDARMLALLAAIAAIDAGLRLALVTGIAGFSPIFFLVLCAGYAFGPSYGFLAGALALLVSAVATGGIGPWLPFQLFGVGWVGLVAGVAGVIVGRSTGRSQAAAPTRRDLVILALVGAAMGLVYGGLLDVWDWTFFRGAGDIAWVPGLPLPEMLQRFGRFYLVTSLGYDTFRAVGNALMVLALGAPVLAAFWRIRIRSSFRIVDASSLGASPLDPTLTKTDPLSRAG
jgi:energy-coupling factor transport system substrate-specific component